MGADYNPIQEIHDTLTIYKMSNVKVCTITSFMLLNTVKAVPKFCMRFRTVFLRRILADYKTISFKELKSDMSNGYSIYAL